MFDNNDFEQLAKLENKDKPFDKYILSGVLIFIVIIILFLFYSMQQNSQQIADSHDVLLSEIADLKKTNHVNLDNKNNIKQTNVESKSLIKIDNNKISIISSKVSLRVLLQEFAKKFNLNLLIPKSVDGNIALSLQNISWNDAFDNILKSNNLSSVYKDNIISISPEIKLNKQIQIEARMVRINLHYVNDLGINWNLEELSLGNLMFSKELNSKLIDPKLSLYENQGILETLSNPRIIVSENKPARIEQGQSIPYQEIAKYGATVTSFKNASLSMKVIASIKADNKILLNLSFSNNFANLQNKVNNYPVIETQELETEVLINSKATIVLGGIISNMSMQNKNNVPVISNAPIFGSFFKNKMQNKDKSEFFIFLTAKII